MKLFLLAGLCLVVQANWKGDNIMEPSLNMNHANKEASMLLEKYVGSNYTCTDDADAVSQCRTAHALGRHKDISCDSVMCKDGTIGTSEAAFLQTGEVSGKSKSDAKVDGAMAISALKIEAVPSMTFEECTAHFDQHRGYLTTVDRALGHALMQRITQLSVKEGKFKDEHEDNGVDTLISVELNHIKDHWEFKLCKGFFGELVKEGERMETFFGEATVRDIECDAAEYKMLGVCEALDVYVENLAGEVKPNKTRTPLHCTSFAEVLDVWYHTANRKYHANTDNFCTMVVMDVLYEAGEPECLQFMMDTALEHHKLKPEGTSGFWPGITQSDKFPEAAEEACKAHHETPATCGEVVKAIQEIGMTLANQPEQYIEQLCDAAGHSLAEFPGSPAHRMHTRRGYIHQMMHNVGRKQAEAAGKVFKPKGKEATIEDSLLRGLRNLHRPNPPSPSPPSMMEAIEARAGRRQGANATSGEKNFERLLEGKGLVQAFAPMVQAFVPAPPPPPPPPQPTSVCYGGGCTSTYRHGYRGLCSEEAHTLEGGLGGGGGGVALGVSAGWADGFQTKKTNHQCGLQSGFAGVCGGYDIGTDMAGSVGVSIGSGWYDKFDKIPGYSKIYGFEIGVSIFVVGGGYIECCDSNWNGCSGCGGFAAGGLEFGPDAVLPVNGGVQYLLCHSWMTGLSGFTRKPSSDCGDWLDAVMDCFPGESLVQTPLGPAEMKDLRVGDKVLTAKEGGELAYEDVYFFGHADPTSLRKYVELHLAGRSTPLRISSKHFVPLCPERGEACSYGDRVYKHAGEVLAGDFLWVVADGGEKGSDLALRAVASVGSVVARGLYNPYTLGGSIVVNGVLASAHSNWILDDVVPSSLKAHLPTIYQALFAPGRWLYHLAGAPAADFLDLNSPMSLDHGHGLEFLLSAWLQLPAMCAILVFSAKAAARATSTPV